MVSEPLYADDPDVHIVFPVIDDTAQAVAFNPVIKIEGEEDIVGEWLGGPESPRDLKVPLYGLPAGFMFMLRLAIPDHPDIDLGYVILDE